MVAPVIDNDERADKPLQLGESSAGEPRVALLDGIPVGRHEALDGRLRIDDPETRPRRFAWRRHHGSLMASLVVDERPGGQATRSMSPSMYGRSCALIRRRGLMIRRRWCPWIDYPSTLIHRAVAHLFKATSRPRHKLERLSSRWQTPASSSTASSARWHGWSTGWPGTTTPSFWSARATTPARSACQPTSTSLTLPSLSKRSSTRFAARRCRDDCSLPVSRPTR